MAKTNTRHPQNFFGMVENIFIASMTKGQAPLFVIGALIALMIWKMPAEDITKLANRILDALIKGQILGYALGGCAITGWFVHARVQRKTITREMERLADARDERQATEKIMIESSSK